MKVRDMSHSSLLRTLLLFSLPILIGIFLTGCEEDEDNAIAQAQECFNNLDDSAVDSAADECLGYISSLTSQEAYVLQCGILSWQGGLRTSTIVTAFDSYDAAPANQKEATLIEALAMDDSNDADAAYDACKASNVAGLVYIASLAKIATTMDAISGSSNPNQVVQDCLADANNCANAETGEILVTAAELYCVGESANSDVCQTISAAVAANPNDYAAIAQAFLADINY